MDGPDLEMPSMTMFSTLVPNDHDSDNDPDRKTSVLIHEDEELEDPFAVLIESDDGGQDFQFSEAVDDSQEAESPMPMMPSLAEMSEDVPVAKKDETQEKKPAAVAQPPPVSKEKEQETPEKAVVAEQKEEADPTKGTEKGDTENMERTLLGFEPPSQNNIPSPRKRQTALEVPDPVAETSPRAKAKIPPTVAETVPQVSQTEPLIGKFEDGPDEVVASRSESPESLPDLTAPPSKDDPRKQANAKHGQMDIPATSPRKKRTGSNFPENTAPPSPACEEPPVRPIPASPVRPVQPGGRFPAAPNPFDTISDPVIPPPGSPLRKTAPPQAPTVVQPATSVPIVTKMGEKFIQNPTADTSQMPATKTKRRDERLYTVIDHYPPNKQQNTGYSHRMVMSEGYVPEPEPQRKESSSFATNYMPYPQPDYLSPTAANHSQNVSMWEWIQPDESGTEEIFRYLRSFLSGVTNSDKALQDVNRLERNFRQQAAKLEASTREKDELLDMHMGFVTKVAAEMGRMKNLYENEREARRRSFLRRLRRKKNKPETSGWRRLLDQGLGRAE